MSLPTIPILYIMCTYLQRIRKFYEHDRKCYLIIFRKSTFFNVMTKSQAAAENFPFCTIDPNESKLEKMIIVDSVI